MLLWHDFLYMTSYIYGMTSYDMAHHPLSCTLHAHVDISGYGHTLTAKFSLSPWCDPNRIFLSISLTVNKVHLQWLDSGARELNRQSAPSASQWCIDLVY